MLENERNWMTHFSISQLLSNAEIRLLIADC